MNQQTNDNNNHEKPKGITKIGVSGYKSLYEESSIEVRPLTILAGANSSGKSSIMQPLLLMKQTLEATYDPGALLLNGPNVKFTSAKQIFSKFGRHSDEAFSIFIEIENRQSINTIFIKPNRQDIEIVEMVHREVDKEFVMHPGIVPSPMIPIIQDLYKDFYDFIQQLKLSDKQIVWLVDRSRCFLDVVALMNEIKSSAFPSLNLLYPSPSKIFGSHIRKLIHIPGLRGNPERNYKTTGIGSEFPGTFENYVASIINYWRKKGHNQLIKELCRNLEKLGLTYKVVAKQVDDTQVELRVGRLPRQSDTQDDMVNIADVGFGVSQTLPVLVALLVAEPGQLVYIEQPEIHLHPRAQVAMAEILANAAKRGVKVVIETHSDRLLLAIQSLVAEGNLSPDLVKLHWFTRQEDGITRINSADLDETGAFGDWPEDFGDVSLQLENRYLSAAEARLMQGTNGS